MEVQSVLVVASSGAVGLESEVRSPVVEDLVEGVVAGPSILACPG